MQGKTVPNGTKNGFAFRSVNIIRTVLRYFQVRRFIRLNRKGKEMLHIVTLRSLCYVYAVHSKSIPFGMSRRRFSRNHRPLQFKTNN